MVNLSENFKLMEQIIQLVVQMVRDLEDTRYDYRGYSYVRTIRNILIGKEDAAIAPLFSEKPYYGYFQQLQLEEVQQLMDILVAMGRLSTITTDHGKLYCTTEFYQENSWRY